MAVIGTGMDIQFDFTHDFNIPVSSLFNLFQERNHYGYLQDILFFPGTVILDALNMKITVPNLYARLEEPLNEINNP